MRHLLLVTLAACASGEGDPTDTDVDTDALAPFVLEIPGLDPLDAPVEGCEVALPELHECDGANPELRWSGVPDGAAGLVLIFDDPDAGDFPHWAVWDLPTDSTGLAAGVSGRDVASDLPSGAKELDNGFGWTGYLGSCPPTEHVYRWTLWAVDDSFDFTPGSGDARAQFADLRDVAKAARIERATACHVYGPAVDP